MTHQRAIRINGKLVKSPKFERASDANTWYREKQREKLHVKEGIPLPLNDKLTLNQYFDHTWLPKRKKKYPKSTWESDEQRFDDYLRKSIGHLKISKINFLQVKSALEAVVDKHGRSTKTRSRVKALISKIFKDAMNEEGTPLRTNNPVRDITFDDPRQGKKKPVHIAKDSDNLNFIKAAYLQGMLVFAMIVTFIFSGIRKSELIALTWADFDQDMKTLTIRRRYIQAEKDFRDGTKAGSDEDRIVHIPDFLVTALLMWRAETKFKKRSDFIFCDEVGRHLKPRRVWVIVKNVSIASGINAFPHALRHTKGRKFIERGGSLKALQNQLGHSSSAVTEIYSDLASDQTKNTRNIFTFAFDDNGEIIEVVEAEKLVIDV